MRLTPQVLRRPTPPVYGAAWERRNRLKTEYSLLQPTASRFFMTLPPSPCVRDLRAAGINRRTRCIQERKVPWEKAVGGCRPSTGLWMCFRDTRQNRRLFSGTILTRGWFARKEKGFRRAGGLRRNGYPGFRLFCRQVFCKSSCSVLSRKSSAGVQHRKEPDTPFRKASVRFKVDTARGLSGLQGSSCLGNGNSAFPVRGAVPKGRRPPG